MGICEGSWGVLRRVFKGSVPCAQATLKASFGYFEQSSRVLNLTHKLLMKAPGGFLEESSRVLRLVRSYIAKALGFLADCSGVLATSEGS